MKIETNPLGQVCDIFSGFAWSASKFNKDGRGLPIIRIQNVDSTNGNDFVFWGEPYDSRFVIRNGHILLTLSGSFRVVAWSGPDALLNQRIVKLTPKSKLDAGWLLHVLRPRLEQIERMGRHALVNNVSIEDIRNLEIPLPPLPEQQRIAAILDRAEALRAMRRDALGQLDALTQSIFLDMFGDPMKPHEGWQTSTFGEAATHLAYGPRFFNESYSSSGIRIVRITDLDDAGSLNFDAMPRMLVDIKDEQNYALQGGDVLFARSGSVGKSAVFPMDSPVCIAGAYFIVMRFKPTVTSLFARSVINAPSVRNFIQVRSRQAIQPNFSGPGLRALPLPVPPLPLQREFARRVAAVEKLKAAHRASLAALDALFASLQHRAFRGEL